MKAFILLFGLLCISGVLGGPAGNKEKQQEPRRCEFSNSVDQHGNGTVTETEMVCAKESKYCFALWKVDVTKNSSLSEAPVLTFIKQGCWEAAPSPNDQCPPGPTCTAYYNPHKTPPPQDVYFCCCGSDFCNINVELVESSEEDLEEDEEAEPLINKPESSGLVVALIVTIVGILLLIILVISSSLFIWHRQNRSHPKKGKKMEIKEEEEEKLMEPIHKDDSCWELSQNALLLGDEIAKGKFGTVFDGTLTPHGHVAYKLFTNDQREFFENERFIYHCLGKTSNASIVKYYGWAEWNNQMVLALSRITPGNLRDFLSKEGTKIDLNGALKIMRGIANGLSFLHGENRDEVVIVHRDLTSKNVLISSNLDTYLSDFGLSLLTEGSKYYFAGRERQAEFCSLAEAGTLRYMAPELLEGAVNLKDCENALKQADVYALALVLWEVANVCGDLGLHENCPYALPFEIEIGKDINMETLTRYVVQRRERPSFRNWRDSPISRAIRDTLTESWDPEPDARLTSLCVVERLAELTMTGNSLNNKNKGENNIAIPLDPLPPPPMNSPWTGRNPCMQRNLLEESTTDDSRRELLITSSEKRMAFEKGLIGSSTEVTETSVTTANTDLSASSTGGGGHFNPHPIPFLQNIPRARIV